MHFGAVVTRDFLEALPNRILPKPEPPKARSQLNGMLTKGTGSVARVCRINSADHRERFAESANSKRNLQPADRFALRRVATADGRRSALGLNGAKSMA
jgi:hypothetical protein